MRSNEPCQHMLHVLAQLSHSLSLLSLLSSLFSLTLSSLFSFLPCVIVASQLCTPRWQRHVLPRGVFALSSCCVSFFLFSIPPALSPLSLTLPKYCPCQQPSKPDSSCVFPPSITPFAIPSPLLHGTQFTSHVANAFLTHPGLFRHKP